MKNEQKANDWFRQGNSFYEAKHFEEALRCYDQAVNLDPGNTRAWDNRGLCLANLNRHAEAIPSYDKALQIDPQNVAGWCNRGISLSALNRNVEALQSFDKALNLNTQHSIIWQKKGDSLRNLGRRGEAITCYNTAVRLEENNALAWYYKGVCEDELGERQNARFSYSTVITLSMGVDPEFTMENGKSTLKAWSIQPVLIEPKLSAHALERFNELDHPANTVTNPKKNSAAIGNTTSESFLHGRAVTPSLPTGVVSNSVIAQNEQLQNWELEGIDANDWFFKGKSLIVLGKFEEALHCFDKALALESQDEYMWCEKAGCEEKLGRTQDAIHSYNKVLDFADDDALGLINAVVAHLAELERAANYPSNRQEDLIREAPQFVQTTANPPSDYIYQPGDMIGQNYEVHSVLGYGGCGIVYLVYSHITRQVYALKTFLDIYMENPEARKRFRKEAFVLVELERHPYLVRAYVVDEISGRLFVAMDYIAPNKEGINTLEGFLKRHPPTLEQSLCWSIQVCYGMEYAFSKGVRAHRDLKPANIMISGDGRAMVTDFGLASIFGQSQEEISKRNAMRPSNQVLSGKTQVGKGFGTPDYMPPEQFENAAGCDERSDIYSLGIILFEMADNGNLPFSAPRPRDNSDAEIFRFTLAMQQLHKQAPVRKLDSPLFPVI